MKKKPKRPNPITSYWLKHYIKQGQCALCGNSGIVDTRTSARSAAGFGVGMKTFCICPNGQSMREAYKKR